MGSTAMISPDRPDQNRGQSDRHGSNLSPARETNGLDDWISRIICGMRLEMPSTRPPGYPRTHSAFFFLPTWYSIFEATPFSWVTLSVDALLARLHRTS